MSESSGESLPQRKIIQRTNAIHSDFQDSSKAVSTRGVNKSGSSLGSKAASIVLGGLALGGSAAVINAVTENSATVHAAQAAVPEEQKIETKAQVQEKTSVKSHEKVEVQSDIFDTVFHDLDDAQLQKARDWVEEFKVKIAAKPGYEKEHRQIPQEYKEIIKNTANVYGISEQMLYGIIAIENGGGPDVTNGASKARGVAQFLAVTANQYGLKVDENHDQRADPVLSIDAAGKYLQVHRDLFAGDVGLTMWSYHAGAGNVYHALQVYIRDAYGVDIGSYSETMDDTDSKVREQIERDTQDFIKKKKIGFYDLVSNKAVKEEVIKDLHDYSDTYVPSIMAILKLEDEREEREVNLGGGLTIAVPKNAFPTR